MYRVKVVIHYTHYIWVFRVETLPLVPGSLITINWALLYFQLVRASNPRCMFWNATSNRWEDNGVQTVEVSKGEVGEYKTFNVRGRANHLTAFAVLVDQSALSVS